MLCYFFGHEKQQNRIVDGIIFPNQISTASNVDDIGINGSNTFQWLQENHPDKTLFAWVHTHVQGMIKGDWWIKLKFRLIHSTANIMENATFGSEWITMFCVHEAVKVALKCCS